MEKARITRLDYFMSGKFDITQPSFLSFLRNSDFVDRGKYFLWRKDKLTVKINRNGRFWAVGFKPERILKLLPVKFTKICSSITYLRLPFVLDLGKTLDKLVERQKEGLMHFSFFYSVGGKLIVKMENGGATIVFGTSTAKMFFSSENYEKYMDFVSDFIKHYGCLRCMKPEKDYVFPHKQQYEIWSKPKRYAFDCKRLYS